MPQVRARAIGRRAVATAAAGIVVCLFAVQCGQAPTTPTPAPGQNTPTVPGPNNPNLPGVPIGPAIFVGAGDIANCAPAPAQPNNHLGTARLVENIGGTVFTTGDNAYGNGDESEFRNCYDLSWGRPVIKDRTFPAPGNHDYGEPSRRGNANPYFNYFGGNAGPYGLGYWSYPVGAWHVIQLNSNVQWGGPGVDAASAQVAWLQGDLAANPSRCTLAYWHHPLFSSGPNGDQTFMRPIFQVLYDAGVDVVVTGHDHMYQRFKPQAADGRLDPARGVVQFVVGTGGTALSRFGFIKPNSDFHFAEQAGVLKLTLNAETYQWEFITRTSNATIDPGSAACH